MSTACVHSAASFYFSLWSALLHACSGFFTSPCGWLYYMLAGVSPLPIVWPACCRNRRLDTTAEEMFRRALHIERILFSMDKEVMLLEELLVVRTGRLLVMKANMSRMFYNFILFWESQMSHFLHFIILAV